MNVKVLVAQTCGLCYGSKRALDLSMRELSLGKKVVFFKEILHNKNVLNSLKNKGAKIKERIDEIDKNDFVIVRAHGEPLKTFKYFENNGISYLDCTCPNVKAIANLVKIKTSEGYKIILLGKYGFNKGPMHPEVEGIVGWCDNPILIEDESEIENLDLTYDKYFLVVQTTFSKDKAEYFIERIERKIKNAGKEFEFRNTICSAQKQINLSAESLAKEVDVMLVLGGKNSSNTKELFSNISKLVKSYHIELPENVLDLIESGIIIDGMTIGVTAGASTMKEDILKVKDILEAYVK